MTKTIQNLKEAFAGESQASMKYRIFAEKADAEGFGQAARMFRAASQAEKLHAETHLKNLDMVNDTATNLQAAVDGDTYEFSTMYPEFIKEGEAEGGQANPQADGRDPQGAGSGGITPPGETGWGERSEPQRFGI